MTTSTSSAPHPSASASSDSSAIHTRPRRSDMRVGPEPADLTPTRRFPAWVRVLLAVATMFAAAFSPAVWAVIPDLDARMRQWPDPVVALAMVVFYGTALLTTLALVWLLMRLVDRRPFSDVGWTWNARSLPAFGLGLAVTIAVALLVGMATATVTHLRPMPAPEAHGAPMWLVLVTWLAMAFLLQGIGEEIVWRGYVFQTLRLSPVATAYVSAAVFALLHLTSQGGQQNAWERVVYLAIPFGFALLAGALVLRTGSLWSAIGVHGGFHIATMIGTLWLGLGTGPALWAAQGLALAAVGATLLHLRGNEQAGVVG